MGAVVLALLGVVVLVVRPQRDTRAEARVTVPAALDLNEVITAIRTDAVGATVTADGRRVTVAFRDDDSFVARTYVNVRARGGLDAARRHQTAVQTRRAEAARSDRADAAASIASIARRTGVEDPESAYRDRVQRGRDLEAQRAAAVAAGQPLAEIDGALAVNQQEVAELQLRVTRHTELIAEVNAADGRALAATRAIDTTDRAVRAASVQVSDQETGFGFGILPGVAILVIAALVLLVNELVPGRAASRDAEIDIRSDAEPAVGSEPEPVPAVRRDEVVPAHSDDERETTRFSRFYRALEPSAPPLETDVPSPLDLVEEEIREVNGDLEQQAVAEQPQAAGDAKATRFSR